MSVTIDTPVQFLKGVGPKFGSILAKRGIGTVGDLIQWFPRAYEDRRAVRRIDSLQMDQIVSIKAQVLKVRSMNLGKSHRKMYEVIVKDDTGRIACKYFRVPYKGYFERFQPFMEVRVVGKVTLYRNQLEFHHPDIFPINEAEENQDQLMPIYTETEGLSPQKLHKIMQIALKDLVLSETLPAWVVEKYRLISRIEAFKSIHLPPSHLGDQLLKFESEAQKRIIFEEFFWLELYLASRKAGVEKEKSIPMLSSGAWSERLKGSLEFRLTSAQLRTYDEIVADLKKPHPMHRLVQGDVGCGKTLVALLAATYAAEAGVQTALMVPTEILAEQHFLNAQRRLNPLGIKVALLTGSKKTAERQAALDGIKSGEIHILIGTHALIQDEVEFKNLGLAIIDEQHRFGVEQRMILKQKGVSPHFLVMTATPIPRTLAMTVYGDLDVSIIDELPAGRQPIITRKAFESKRPQVMQFLREQLQKGRQAYVVYPLVEESEKIDLKNAIDEFEKIKKLFPEFKVGLLHGRMKPAEKDEVMHRFRRNELQILVATTVIEVGVDVPNANLMIIEHTERFGLSQLHQLRGRVGRGEHKSYCVLLLGYAVSEESRVRAEIMEKTNDGFKIAEADLEIRGPGEFLGTRQSGLPGFKLANLVRDVRTLQDARQAAFELIKRDPDLRDSSHGRIRQQLERAREAIVG
ncbi:MAG: ATP-dependent DNA helicase RecG [Bdellovibrionales bacterium]